jgi:hypothetical protein
MRLDSDSSACLDSCREELKLLSALLMPAHKFFLLSCLYYSSYRRYKCYFDFDLFLGNDEPFSLSNDSLLEAIG